MARKSAKEDKPVADNGQERLQISDTDLEESVLGVMLTSPEQITEVNDIISEDCFYSSFNKVVYKAISNIVRDNGTVDIFMVANEVCSLLGKGSEEMSNVSFSVAKIASKSSWIGFRNHVELLREYSNKRKLSILGMKIKEAGFSSGTTSSDIINEAQKVLDEISTDGKGGVSSLGDMLKDIYHEISENQKEGRAQKKLTTTGFQFLDGRACFTSSSLIIIGGQTSSGKTSLATSITINAIKGGRKVGFLSMEMSKMEVVARLIAMETEIPSNRILFQRLTNSEMEMVDGAIGVLSDCADRLYIDPMPTMEIGQISSSIRAMKLKYDVDGVVVDYIQMIKCSGTSRAYNREEELAYIARELRNDALKNDIWVLALSQLHRDQMPDSPPTLNSLRGSGQIAEAADTVLLLYRPTDGKARYPAPYGNVSTEGTAMLKMEKGRNIGTGVSIFGFNPVATLYYEFDRLPYIDDSARTETSKQRKYDESIPF